MTPTASAMKVRGLPVDHADRQRQIAEPNKVLFEFLVHPLAFYYALVLALRDEACGCPQYVALRPENRQR